MNTLKLIVDPPATLLVVNQLHQPTSQPYIETTQGRAHTALVHPSLDRLDIHSVLGDGK